MFERDDALLAADHMAGNGLFVELAFKLHDDFPGLRLVPGEKRLRILDEQGVDVDDMALDQQIVRPLSQLDQRPGDLLVRTSTGGGAR